MDTVIFIIRIIFLMMISILLGYTIALKRFYSVLRKISQKNIKLLDSQRSFESKEKSDQEIIECIKNLGILEGRSDVLAEILESQR